jgi:hypothetical protein
MFLILSGPTCVVVLFATDRYAITVPIYLIHVKEDCFETTILYWSLLVVTVDLSAKNIIFGFEI